MATPLKWPRAGMRDQTMKSLSSLIQLASRNLKSLKPVNQSLVADRFIRFIALFVAALGKDFCLKVDTRSHADFLNACTLELQRYRVGRSSRS